MSLVRHYVLAAGGTGGHMVPAHALAVELIARGHKVALVTDARGAKIPALFDGVPVHVLPAGRLAGGVLAALRAIRGIVAGRAAAKALYREFRPSCVVGFGGYPALPALLAAQSMGIPSVIHDQNAVLGRTNRLLAGRVSAIATAYPEVKRLKHPEKVELVGNPVRAEILKLRDAPFELGEKIHLLVTGGSQGATILSRVVPDGLAMLPEPLKRRLRIVQQCRPEDIEAVRGRYRVLGISAELATYLPDMPERLAWAHLVVGRAGASTVAELTVAGRPAILIPYAAAMDDHQTANAAEMVATGGAVAIAEAEFTPQALAKAIADMAERLPEAAKAARKAGRPDAAERLADLVESFGKKPRMQVIEVKRKRPSGGRVQLAGATKDAA